MGVLVQTFESTAAWNTAINRSTGAHLLGFYQDRDGRAVRITSDKTNYRSDRQIDNYEPRRCSSIGNIHLHNPQGSELKKGKYFDLLPNKLKDILESGAIPLYERDKPKAAHLDNELVYNPKTGKVEYASAMTQPDNNAPFRILHFSYEYAGHNGRTAILLDNNNQPVVINIEGLDYCIELKGCGCSDGKIGDKSMRSGYTSFHGGLMRKAAADEFDNLELDRPNAGCKSGAVAFFTFAGEQLGYIVRLSPSTVRASYNSNNCFPSKEATGKCISRAYAQLLVEQITDRMPYLMHDSAHFENILVTPHRFYWTDYSDQVRLGASSLPHYNQGDFITHKTLVNQVFMGLAEVPGYELAEFIAEFNRQTERLGMRLQLDPNDSADSCSQKIFSFLLADRIFEDRQKLGFTHNEFLRDFVASKAVLVLTPDKWDAVKNAALQKLATVTVLPEGIDADGLNAIITALEQERIADLKKLLDSYNFSKVISALGPEIKLFSNELAMAYPWQLFELLDYEESLLENCSPSAQLQKYKEHIAHVRMTLIECLNSGISGLNQLICDHDCLIKIFSES